MELEGLCHWVQEDLFPLVQVVVAFHGLGDPLDHWLLKQVELQDRVQEVVVDHGHAYLVLILAKKEVDLCQEVVVGLVS